MPANSLLISLLLLNSQVSEPERVYQDLVRTADASKAAPTFTVERRAPPGHAFAWLQEGQIGLERRAIVACERQTESPNDCIAFILGHELAHHYKDHDLRVLYGSEATETKLTGPGAPTAATREMAESIDHTRYEFDADVFGGFGSYLAGYSSIGVAAPSLAALYAQLNTATVNKGYPTLQQRLGIAARSEKKILELIDAFETANDLVILGRYREAAALYDAVRTWFPSRELLNNAAVARLLFARTQIKDIPYLFPFELDTETRLRTGESKKGNPAPDTERLIREAIDLLKLAEIKEREYLPAQVNLAAAHALLGDLPFALAYADRAVATAKKAGPRSSLAAAYTAQGIALAMSEKPAEAEAAFQAADFSSVAVANLNILKGVPPKSSPRSNANDQTEKIAGLSLERASPSGVPIQEITLPGKPLRMAVKRGAGWRAAWVEHGNAPGRYLATDKHYKGETARRIKIGAPLSAVRSVYAEPTRILATHLGEVHCYDVQGIAFLLEARDAELKVTRWFLFEPL